MANFWMWALFHVSDLMADKIAFTGFKGNLIKGNKKLQWFSFLKFFDQKLSSIILIMIFVLDYLTRRKIFSSNIISFINVDQNQFCKNVPCIWWFSTKLSCEISKKPLKISICVLKSIEFQLKNYEIPQLSSRHSTSNRP